jgi:hypothetical protein
VLNFLQTTELIASQLDMDLAAKCAIPVSGNADQLALAYLELLSTLISWMRDDSSFSVDHLYRDRTILRFQSTTESTHIDIKLTDDEVQYLRANCCDAVVDAQAAVLKLAKATQRHQKAKCFFEYLLLTNFLTRKNALELPSSHMKVKFANIISRSVSQGVAAWSQGEIEQCFSIYKSGMAVSAVSLSLSLGVSFLLNSTIVVHLSLCRSLVSIAERPRVYSVLRTRSMLAGASSTAELCRKGARRM